MRALEGVIKNLSELHKMIEGDKVYVCHCQCLKEGLWEEEHTFTEGRCTGVLTSCKVCGLFPWITNRRKSK
jgi:hypothetical protein